MDTLSVWMGALFLPLATAGDLFGKWACPSFGKKKNKQNFFFDPETRGFLFPVEIVGCQKIMDARWVANLT